MITPPQLEMLVKERTRRWDDEVYHNYLLSQIPHKTPRWRKNLGYGLSAAGGWLLGLGEWLSQGAYNVTGIVQGEYSNEHK